MGHCAPYRPNEKGRVERAIQDVRDNFFAARDFASVADLNLQAVSWCREIALERRVPDQRHKSVEDGTIDAEPCPPFAVDASVEAYASRPNRSTSTPHGRR
jgi:hypothetical protein